MYKILCVFIFIIVVNCDDKVNSKDVKITEENDYVVVHFMDFKRSELLEVLPELKKTLANLLQKYCDDNLEVKCTSASKQNFSSESIEFVGANDKDRFTEDNRYVIAKLKLFVIDKSTRHYLPKSIVEDFLTKSRNNVASDAHVEIAYLNNKLVYPLRDNLDNYIIIPVSIVIVLILIVLNFICQRKREKEIINEVTNHKPIYKKGDEINDDEPEKFPLTPTIRESYENHPSFNSPKRPIVKFTEV